MKLSFADKNLIENHGNVKKNLARRPITNFLTRRTF